MFFTYDDSFGKKEVFQYIQTFEYKQILNQTDTQIDVLLNGLKVTSFNALWGFLQPLKIQKFNLSSLESIATMKTNVLFLRAKYRDYYDLYFLVKKYEFKKIFECNLDILEGINFKLFSVAIVYTDGIEDDSIDYLEPIENIRDFFQKRLQ